jgi:hypothetical protein
MEIVHSATGPTQARAQLQDRNLKFFDGLGLNAFGCRRSAVRQSEVTTVWRYLRSSAQTRCSVVSLVPVPARGRQVMTQGDPGAGPASPALMQALAAHPEQMADLVGTLDGRVLDTSTLLDLMGRICRAAVRLLDGVGWAGITAQFDGPPLTAAHTDRRVLIVDEFQYQLNDGPCLRAMRTNAVVAMTAAEIGQQWPTLGVAARQNGIHTVRAVPLEANDRPVGALNLYSPHDKAVDPDLDVLRVLTEYASRGLADFQNSAPHPDREELVRRTVAHWATVEQAIDILMQVHGFGNDYAHQVLVDQAQDWGRTVSDQAAYVISDNAS